MTVGTVPVQYEKQHCMYPSFGSISLNPDQDLSILLYPNPDFSESRDNPNPDLDPHQGFCNPSEEA
jgi:hypothetical protein